MFQHTAARRRLAHHFAQWRDNRKVSTHSRPKAAGLYKFLMFATNPSFNTQPPEGGWLYPLAVKAKASDVSTHSRPKAAGCSGTDKHGWAMSFNTQPPEGGWEDIAPKNTGNKSFNTQPPEGGWLSFAVEGILDYISFNTQPPEGGWSSQGSAIKEIDKFQHTAARRRLGLINLTKHSATCFNTQPPEGGWFTCAAFY